ncbi:MAG: hypothetical protein R3F43_01870 [bacterium]
MDVFHDDTPPTVRINVPAVGACLNTPPFASAAGGRPRGGIASITVNRTAAAFLNAATTVPSCPWRTGPTSRCAGQPRTGPGCGRDCPPGPARTPGQRRPEPVAINLQNGDDVLAAARRRRRHRPARDVRRQDLRSPLGPHRAALCRR